MPLDKLAVNAGWTQSGQLVRGVLPARQVLAFAMAPGPAQIWSLQPIGQDDLIVVPANAEILVNTPAKCFWGTIGLDVEELTRRSVAMVGRDLSAPSGAASVQHPQPGAIQNLRTVHAEITRLARMEPSTLTDPNVIRDFSEAVWSVVLPCLADSESRVDRVATRRHATIMGRFHALLDGGFGEALQVADVCAALGVSESTLHACCQASVGMSPLRYIRIRRLNLVRRALAAGNPTTMTVASIATEHGFWELGRFAASYRQLFGELPSVTLRKG